MLNVAQGRLNGLWKRKTQLTDKEPIQETVQDLQSGTSKKQVVKTV